MNINLMNYGTNEQVGEYVDMFVSNGFKFRIAQPTHISKSSATLIDHMIDNLDGGKTVTSGVLTTILDGAQGYSDHFPTYTVVKRPAPKATAPTTAIRRNFNQTRMQDFKQKLAQADFGDAYVESPDVALENMILQSCRPTTSASLWRQSR
jgi:hypothetical protein